MLGVYFADAGQHLENRLFVDHSAPHTTSNVATRARCRAPARTVSGSVTCSSARWPRASRPSSRTGTCCLTEGARADSVPNLEIETGEIVGAGARERHRPFRRRADVLPAVPGITEDQARRLVVRGFFADIIKRIGIPRHRVPAARGHRGRASRHRQLTRPSSHQEKTETVATLEIHDLHVSVTGEEGPKEILSGVDLTVSSGQTHALMGPNGSGKSTLAYSIAGHPKYHGHIGPRPARRRGRAVHDRRRAGSGRSLPGHAVPRRGARRLGVELPAHRGHGGPRRGAQAAHLGQGSQRVHGRAGDRPDVRRAQRQRGLLGRGEEASRDPADDAPRAEDRHPRRDRLRPGHRRAARGQRGREQGPGHRESAPC